MPDRDDLRAERNQRDRDDLEAREAERDADDRQAEQHARDQVPEGQPPTEQDDPEHVPDCGADPSTRPPLDGAAKWPEDIARDAECGDPERNRNDEDEADDASKHVGDSHPESLEHEPDDVEDRADHDVSTPLLIT